MPQIYEQILRDEKIRKIYDQMEAQDEKENDSLHHGWIHIRPVIERAEMLMKLAGGDETYVEEAKIAALLHDVGKLQGSDDHARRSYEYVKEYLKKKKIELRDRKEVLEAIRVHSDGFDSKSLLALVLILADKLDQRPERLREPGRSKPGVRQTGHIRNVECTLGGSEFNEGAFTVNFVTDGGIDLAEFSTWKFTRKIFSAIRAFARKIHRYPRILVDGEPWDLHRQILKIAFLQIMPSRLPAGPTDDGLFLETQIEKGIAACRKAREQDADIALFPEMWNTGYQMPQDPERLRALAAAASSAYVDRFRSLAKELGMAIALTFLEAHDPAPRNSVVLIDRKGEIAYLYAKVHTCDFGDERVLSHGEEFPVVSLDTACGPVKVGSMICFDREFPESGRILMLKGAELVLVPNACPMEINRLCQLRGRANENMMAIATCNYPKGQPDCNGHSTLFDGVMYQPDIQGPLDTCLLETGEEEGIYIGTLDLTKLRDYRAYEVHGNAYRRPSLYGILTEEKVEEPFIRPDRQI